MFQAKEKELEDLEKMLMCKSTKDLRVLKDTLSQSMRNLNKVVESDWGGCWLILLLLIHVKYNVNCYVMVCHCNSALFLSMNNLDTEDLI